MGVEVGVILFILEVGEMLITKVGVFTFLKVLKK